MSSTRSETHERILRAAMELIESGDPTVAMGNVAKRAGVSRQAIYLHFESRAALLLELVRWTDEVFGLDEQLAKVAAVEDPFEALIAALRVGVWYEPKIYQLALVLDTSRHSDDAIRAAWDDRMERRRQGYEALFLRLEAIGRLQDGVDVRRAAELVWNVSCPSSYRNLVVECGWSSDEWQDWLVAVTTTLVDS